MTLVATTSHQRRSLPVPAGRADEPQPVLDCAEWAWFTSTKTCLTGVAADLLTRHGAALHAAAVALISPHLVFEWAMRGAVAVLVPAAGFAPDPGEDADRQDVADAAAAAIDPATLLYAAGLPGSSHVRTR